MAFFSSRTSSLVIAPWPHIECAARTYITPFAHTNGRTPRNGSRVGATARSNSCLNMYIQKKEKRKKEGWTRARARFTVAADQWLDRRAVRAPSGRHVWHMLRPKRDVGSGPEPLSDAWSMYGESISRRQQATACCCRENLGNPSYRPAHHTVAFCAGVRVQATGRKRGEGGTAGRSEVGAREACPVEGGRGLVVVVVGGPRLVVGGAGGGWRGDGSCDGVDSAIGGFARGSGWVLTW